MKKFFYGVWLVIVAWVILLFIFAVAGGIISLVLVANPVVGLVLDVVAWIAIPLSIAVWAMDDARRFQQKGLDVTPWLWGLGVFFLAGIFLPIYLIYRNIVWPDRISWGTKISPK